jgi:D-alanyl-lipoteichoic acid acyltransferase DltB (MBOAT superfamily)
MLFISKEFLEVFLPCVILAFYLCQAFRSWLGVLVLLSASLIFCANNGVWQVALLAASILFNFSTGLALTKIQKERAAVRKAALLGGVGVNLLALGYFKYAGFLVSILNSAFAAGLTEPHITLPVGVSFYTFTQIAFLADVHAGRGPREPSLWTYALFVTYFPHVVAGPIIHWREMMPQFEAIALNARSIYFNSEHRANICRGATLLGIGLAKKLLIADQLAPFVERGYAAAANIGCADAWLLSLSYTFQLYFDFSGYTDMAIGMSLIFGVQLPFNFNAPYRAVSIQDFWRRWHMTLSRWLRDYVFIPMGGSRGGAYMTLRNLLLTFLIGGLWHGASWTFVVWGGLHGIASCIHRLWSGAGFRLPAPFAVASTFLFVNAAWVFFRAPDLSAAFDVLSAMASPSRGLTAYLHSPQVYTLVALAALLTWTMPVSQWIALETKFATRPVAAMLTGASLTIAILALNTSTPSPFLYFNF